jgi:hypothetical protein
MGGLISCMIFLELLFFCGFLGFSDLMRVICYFPLSGCIFHASCVVRQCLFCISPGSLFTGENSA